MLTTGTMGKYKWLVVGKSFWENLQASAISTAVLACSESWGESTIKRRDKGLNINDRSNASHTAEESNKYLSLVWMASRVSSPTRSICAEGWDILLCLLVLVETSKQLPSSLGRLPRTDCLGTNLLSQTSFLDAI